jgi:hypothetical protein
MVVAKVGVAGDVAGTVTEEGGETTGGPVGGVPCAVAVLRIEPTLRSGSVTM